ncbi:gamma-glutamyl-gamma-aminobutyrate hydrolase family protein [Haloechinothrix salitolerans]|uniref:Gamma-glutamyl-gamma-aminobutyrate hydrolase family protein n=1 Tax=Haloechinothrix salitolerans TaxID=926830 RepID=A0ABW2C3N2_9PSEU
MASNGSSTTRPLIGLTTYAERAQTGVWDTDFALLPYNYVESVSRAGGVPVLLPPIEHGAEEVVAALDGLVVSGGADIDPARYGHQSHPATTATRPGRDEWEAELVRHALPRDLPVLGVCRGAQLLNVALGGTLHQHLPDVVEHEAHRPGPAVFGATRVRLAAGSLAATILGDDVKVPCYHHQALDRIAPALTATGWATDGTVEAVELPGHRFVLGVQWHPEQDADDLRLFQALVTASSAASHDKEESQ